MHHCGETWTGRVVLQRDRPMRAPQQLEHDGQPETGTSGVPIPWVVKSGKPLEDPLPFINGYAGSVIDDC